MLFLPSLNLSSSFDQLGQIRLVQGIESRRIRGPAFFRDKSKHAVSTSLLGKLLKRFRSHIVQHLLFFCLLSKMASVINASPHTSSTDSFCENFFLFDASLFVSFQTMVRPYLVILHSVHSTQQPKCFFTKSKKDLSIDTNSKLFCFHRKKLSYRTYPQNPNFLSFE